MLFADNASQTFTRASLDCRAFLTLISPPLWRACFRCFLLVFACVVYICLHQPALRARPLLPLRRRRFRAPSSPRLLPPQTWLHFNVNIHLPLCKKLLQLSAERLLKFCLLCFLALVLGRFRGLSRLNPCCPPTPPTSFLLFCRCHLPHRGSRLPPTINLNHLAPLLPRHSCRCPLQGSPSTLS